MHVEGEMASLSSALPHALLRRRAEPAGLLPLRPLQRHAGRRARRAAHLPGPARAVLRAVRRGRLRDLPEHGEHGVPLPARMLAVRRGRLPARQDATVAHRR